MIRILSLGAGVQSSTLALMIAHGEVPMVQHAIFADTGAEPKKVMAHLAWLEKQLPFPVHRVQRGNLRDDVLRSAVTKERVSSLPFYTSSPDGLGEGALMRQCTLDYKIQPINQKVRELAGIKPRQRVKDWRVEMLIGISWDEATRMKPSRLPFVMHSYPLVDKHLTRGHCLEWMTEHGYPLPPKSACTFCPYHDDAMWRDMKRDDPDSFAEAVEFDEAVRNGVGTTTQKLFLHRSMKPIAEIDFATAEDRGQGVLFGNECEGMCGV